MATTIDGSGIRFRNDLYQLEDGICVEYELKPYEGLSIINAYPIVDFEAPHLGAIRATNQTRQEQDFPIYLLNNQSEDWY